MGSVINSLSESNSMDSNKNKYIRYRESKLTFLLKDSLGGNSRTCIIANISPSSSSFGETLSTLKFAQRAKMIKNNASINLESMGSNDNLRKEIGRLKEELSSAKTMILSLENGVKGNMNGNGFDGKNGDDIEAYKIIIEDSNCKQLELELMLKEM